MTETLADRAWSDRERETMRITRVEPTSDGTYYEIGSDSSTCLLPNQGVEPLVGDTITLWGPGFGYAFRGQAINGTVVWYRTEEEQRLHEKAGRVDLDAKKLAEADAERIATLERIAKLPLAFRQRIAQFEERNPDFYWKFEDYELFTCEQAVVFATTFPTVEALQAFHGLDYAEQMASCPDMSDGHSGNTFGAAMALAACFIQHPEVLPQVHGALCPLVGCEEYGCWAATNTL